MLDLDVAILQLPDPTFYHLDTALALLDGSCAAYIPAAFDDPGRTLLEAAFENLIEVDDLEAREVLAGNLWCPDGRHVLMSAGAPITRSRIESNGFQVLEIETGEFLKSGGSVFCMRQEIREQL
jgi:N-dimethylarginine dimethylaminohydrolase